MGNKILLIEDTTELAALITLYLNKEGMEIKPVESGEEALTALESFQPELVLLDLNLTGMGGFEFLQIFRKTSQVPVLIISARDSEEDIIQGLGDGADEYITKPFSPKVLVARVQAHLRARARSQAPQREGQAVLQIGQIRLDLEARTVTKDGVPVDLSTREFDLLAYLMNNAGQTLSKEQIFHGVWETDYGDVGTVAINIKKLRTKIDPDWAYIKTIWGSGYRFVTKSGFVEGTGGGTDER